MKNLMHRSLTVTDARSYKWHAIDDARSLWQHEDNPELIKDVDRIVFLQAICWVFGRGQKKIWGRVENIPSALEVKLLPFQPVTFIVPVELTTCPEPGDDRYRIVDVRDLSPVWEVYKRPDFDLLQCYG